MALTELIQKGHIEAAFSLLEQNPTLADHVGPDGVSSALLALYYGHRELAETILESKSSLDLYEAAAFGRTNEVEQLIETCDLNALSHDGFTPLHLAAFFGRQDTVRALVANRAELNIVSNNPLGVTPLHSALANKHESVARELVFEGADVNKPTVTGWTPLHYAAQQGNRPLALFLKEHGAVPTVGTEGKSPADLALECGHVQLLDILQ